MPTITRDEVRLAMRNYLLAMDTPTPVLPTYREWENVKLNTAPPDGGYWLRENLLWGGEAKFANVDHQAEGVVQYTVFGPLGGGLKGIDTLADAIKAHFRPGKTPSPGGGTISVFRSETGRGGRDPVLAYWMVPVSIYWRVTRSPR